MTNSDFAAQSAFVSDLLARGYVHQCTDLAGLDALAITRPLIAYVGYDLTAASLHVGHLISIMMLRRLQQAGGKPIVLMGGATTKIGDPSDKDKSRPVLTPEQIAANKAGIKGVFSRFLRFGDGSSDAIMVDNADWFVGVHYLDFLRDYGAHFTINRMLTFDSVKRRLDREQPLTFLEFNYMLLQAVDFLELSRRFSCDLQMGGSDQWGNIVNGVELCRRIEDRRAFGLTTPLLTTASGAKMGKTEGGAVWLNADLTSPYDYWQFWRNTEDADVGRFLALFTDMPVEDCVFLGQSQGADINAVKKLLATEATALVHGRAAAETAAASAAALFEQGADFAQGLPIFSVTRAQVAAGLSAAEAFTLAELTPTRSDARRQAQGGGLRIGARAITDAAERLAPADFDAEGRALLQLGKKKRAVLQITASDD